MRAALDLLREQEAAQDRLDALLDEAAGAGIELTAEVRSGIEKRAVRVWRELPGWVPWQAVVKVRENAWWKLP